MVEDESRGIKFFCVPGMKLILAHMNQWVRLSHSPKFMTQGYGVSYNLILQRSFVVQLGTKPSPSA